MKLKITPGPHLFLGTNFSPKAFRRFLIVLLLVWALVAIALYVLAEATARRWAPAAGQQTTGLLVAFVWVSQIVPFLKRTRSVLGAMRDGLLYSVGLGALLVLAIHYAG